MVMEILTFRTYSEIQCYWVTDNQGKHHLYHDRLAAQLAEIRYEQERRNADA